MIEWMRSFSVLIDNWVVEGRESLFSLLPWNYMDGNDNNLSAFSLPLHSEKNSRHDLLLDTDNILKGITGPGRILTVDNL